MNSKRYVNRRKLLDDLNSLCEFLNNAYDVNSGGCCFLASIIAKHLDKLGIKYKLVIYDLYNKDKESIKYEVTNRRRNKTKTGSVVGVYTCDHYCLYLEGVGIMNRSGSFYSYSISNISHKNIYWIYKNGSWNKRYEVQHNETIKNIVKAFFKEYEKVLYNKNMCLS